MTTLTKTANVTAVNRNRREGSSVPNYVILILLVIFALGPVVVLAFNSVKSSAEVGRNPLGPPAEVKLDNYPRAWTIGQFSTTTGNSVILVVGTIIGVLVFGGTAAYSLAKMNLPGANLLMVYFLITSTLPIQLFLVPLFFLWNKLGLVNNLFGLMLIYIAYNAPVAIFLLRSYMVQLPSEFEDAARVDGADELRVLTKIVIPLSWPGFLTVGLVTGLAVWNEFLLATVFLSQPNLFTVSTSYYNFQTRFSRDWGLTSAAAIMMIAPILVLFMLLQRRFIEGLTQGGLKG
jgi:raffinose/stachyose/melibiose transport system permease protein